jgi:hypothetical protein
MIDLEGESEAIKTGVLFKQGGKFKKMKRRLFNLYADR